MAALQLLITERMCLHVREVSDATKRSRYQLRCEVDVISPSACELSTIALPAFIRLVEYGLPGVRRWLSSLRWVQLLPHTAASHRQLPNEHASVCSGGERHAKQSRYQLRCKVGTKTIIKHRAIHDRIAATDDIITGGCEAFGLCIIPDEVDGQPDCHAL